jgi:hypothetical protein
LAPGCLRVKTPSQEYSDPNQHTRGWKKAMVIAGSTTGTILTTVELLSYAIFFQVLAKFRLQNTLFQQK